VTSRERLLAAVVDHLAEHGVGETSLRQLAEAVGTSHRMLIYHFGSRDGLLAEVVRAVEAEQRAVLERVFADAPAVVDGQPDLDRARAFWAAVVTATLRFGGLFFELSAHAIQGRPHADRLRDDLVGGWLPGLVELLVRLGMPAKVAPTAGRLALGASRGLLLDLLVTGERAEVDRAADLLNELLLGLVHR